MWYLSILFVIPWQPAEQRLVGIYQEYDDCWVAQQGANEAIEEDNRQNEVLSLCLYYDLRSKYGKSN